MQRACARAFAAIAAGAACAVLVPWAALAQTAAVPMCGPADVALGAGGSDRFTGMSQSGTLLTVRNISAAACTIDPFAGVSFRGAHETQLNVIVDRTTPFSGPTMQGRRMPMGPGPVVLPLVLQPNAAASMPLRWVSAPVYDHSVCVDATRIVLALDSGTVRAPLSAHICGATADTVRVSATRLTLDAVRRRIPGEAAAS